MNTVPERLKMLSDKEREVFNMLVLGMNTSEISKMLSLSYRSVAGMSRLIKAKLDVATIEELKKTAGHAPPPDK